MGDLIYLFGGVAAGVGLLNCERLSIKMEVYC